MPATATSSRTQTYAQPQYNTSQRYKCATQTVPLTQQITAAAQSVKTKYDAYARKCEYKKELEMEDHIRESLRPFKVPYPESENEKETFAKLLETCTPVTDEEREKMKIPMRLALLASGNAAAFATSLQKKGYCLQTMLKPETALAFAPRGPSNFGPHNGNGNNYDGVTLKALLGAMSEVGTYVLDVAESIGVQASEIGKGLVVALKELSLSVAQAIAPYLLHAVCFASGAVAMWILKKQYDVAQLHRAALEDFEKELSRINTALEEAMRTENMKSVRLYTTLKDDLYASKEKEKKSFDEKSKSNMAAGCAVGGLCAITAVAAVPTLPVAALAAGGFALYSGALWLLGTESETADTSTSAPS